MRDDRSTRPPEAGFTLIEVLLALSLSAVIASGLYALLWTGGSTWKRMRQRSELQQAGRLVIERLERDLQNSVPLFGGRFKDTQAIEADATHMAFPAVLTLSDAQSASGQRPALGRLQYRWQTSAAGGSPRLVRTWECWLPDPLFKGASAGEDAFPALVTSFALAYPLRNPPPAMPLLVWEDAWPEARRFPEAVRVDVSLRQPETGEELRLRRIIPIWHGQLRPKAAS